VKKINHRKVNDSETGAPYQIRKSQRFAGLENWDCNVDINRLRENITEYIETSAREGGSRSVGVKAVKRWLDEERLKGTRNIAVAAVPTPNE
jgi:hypothetical protein